MSVEAAIETDEEMPLCEHDVPEASLPDLPLSPLELLERAEQLRTLKKALNELSRIDATILNSRFGLEDGHGHTLREISKLVGLSAVSVNCRIHKSLRRFGSLLGIPAKKEQSVRYREDVRLDQRLSSAYYVVDMTYRRAYALSPFCWWWGNQKVQKIILEGRDRDGDEFKNAIQDEILRASNTPVPHTMKWRSTMLLPYVYKMIFELYGWLPNSHTDVHLMDATMFVKHDDAQKCRVGEGYAITNTYPRDAYGQSH